MSGKQSYQLDFLQLADKVPAIITVYRVDSGQYSFVGKAVENILGYKQSQLLEGGVDFITSKVHPDDIASIAEKNQSVLSSANSKKSSKKEPVVSFEYRVKHKNGRWVWLYSDSSVFSRNHEGKVEQVLNVSIDITKRKQAEENIKLVSANLEQQVQLRTERLGLALEASQMGTWEWDVTNDTLSWSDRLYRLFGLDPKKVTITYELYMKMLHPEDARNMRKTINNAMKYGKGYVVEHRCIWPDGSLHWLQGRGKAFLKDGQPTRIIGTTVNIDERKRTSAELETSQMQYQSLFSSNVIGIFSYDKNGHVVEANDMFLKMLGYQRSDIDNRKLEVNKLTPPQYHKLDQEKLAELKKTGEATPWDKYFIRKDGSLLPVLTGGVKSDGHYLSVVIDTTERVELAALNNAKDEFISLASHQLRTPATGVKQYLALMIDGYAGELTPAQSDMLNTAYRSNDRELHIIDDLLKVANLDAGKVSLKVEKYDLVSLTEAVISEMQNNFTRRGQKLKFTHNEENITARVDRHLLRMVIENLLDNACKYSYDNKPVSIDINKTSHEVVITFKDKGVGIEQNELGKLFQKFSRVDNPLSRQVGGSGLGLYWAKKVVDMHGGTIEVKSTAGKGSTFKVVLPD